MKVRERRKKKFLDNSEVKILLSAIAEKYRDNKKVNKMACLYLDLVEFMIRNGLRISEVGALTGDEIDFINSQLTVKQGLIAGGRALKDYQINASKTIASYRKIDLDTCSMEIIINRLRVKHNRLDEMRKRRRGELAWKYIRSDNGKEYEKNFPDSKNYHETDYIFQTQNGNPVVYHSFNEFMNGHCNNTKPVTCVKDILTRKYPNFKKHVTTHTFRYTHISLLAEAGLPIKAIMERVGHSDI
ncbi:hypothetical protein IGI37_001417 [Enterococcus sp. AZ194]|uniref:tyrosine-type recombinase/integrase n=1 Tax=Enterococcus sp. AZ194 TaxID=2774629 RepID=UPI003F20FA73